MDRTTKERAAEELKQDAKSFFTSPAAKNGYWFLGGVAVGIGGTLVYQAVTGADVQNVIETS